jgi:hypothetical protein
MGKEKTTTLLDADTVVVVVVDVRNLCSLSLFLSYVCVHTQLILKTVGQVIFAHIQVYVCARLPIDQLSTK